MTRREEFAAIWISIGLSAACETVFLYGLQQLLPIQQAAYFATHTAEDTRREAAEAVLEKVVRRAQGGR